MPPDGKQLEDLVAFVEQTLVQEGFEVKPNEYIYDDAGNQIAELDVLVKGRIGSTAISWLIECRDRPSDGSAPVSWIEQLVSRRSRLGLNKVTAVSTTGFAPGAITYAQQEGIELRQVTALSPADFSDWLVLSSFEMIERNPKLKHVEIQIHQDESPARQEAARNPCQHDGRFLVLTPFRVATPPRDLARKAPLVFGLL